MHPLPPPPAVPQLDKEALRQEILGQSVDNLEEWLTVDPGAIAVLDGSSKDHSRKNRKAQKQAVHTSKKAKDPDEAVPGLSVATSSGSVPAISYTGQQLPQRGMASTASALEVKAAMEVDSESVDFAGDSDAEPVAKQPKYQLDCARDPSYAAATDARTMSAEEASYFSHVMKGVQWSYLCRKKQCMFFGGNNVETWIKANAGYKFRCPMCGYLHQPWKTGSDDVPAARVLTVAHPITGELMHIPTVNPESKDEGWLNQMIEVTARNMQTEDDVQKWWDRTVGDVNQWLAREGVCRAWTKLSYRPEQHAALVNTNAYDATRQMKNGFVMGLKLTDLDSARQPYTDFNGLISVFANFVAASKALVSKM